MGSGVHVWDMVTLVVSVPLMEGVVDNDNVNVLVGSTVSVALRVWVMDKEGEVVGELEKEGENVVDTEAESVELTL